MAKSVLALLALALSLVAPARAQEERVDPEALVALLRAGSFAQLDERVGAYQRAYEARSDAEWPLVIVFAGFERVDPELEAAFDGWIRASPRSYGARLARAAHFHQRAWSARGGRTGARTPAGRLEAMRRFFARGDEDLAASLELSTRPQLSYHYLISSAMARGDCRACLSLLQEALTHDAEAYASRRAYLNALRPEWGGSMAAMQEVVDELAVLPATHKLGRVARVLRASWIGRAALEAQRAKDYERALELYARGLAEAEDAVLLYNRGRVLVQLGRLDAALRDFDRALELDPAHGDALEHRGNLHERRKEIKPAVQDYERAASYGSAYAMQRLGLTYINGRDVPLDYKRAAKWLELGAAQGEDRAQSALGWMYAEGKGVPQDGRRAMQLWTASASQGNEQARKYLDGLPWYWRARFAVETFFGR